MSKAQTLGSLMRWAAFTLTTSWRNVLKFQITNHGTLTGFTPVDDAAQSWWDENVQWGPMMGDQYMVDHRHAQDIIDGIQAASDELGAGGPIGDKRQA
jgi:hypothetical protein